MKKITLALGSLALVALCANVADAADITGTWQGAVLSQHVLKVTKTNGRLSAMFYNIGNDPTGYPVASISLRGTVLEFKIQQGCGNDQPDGYCKYEGTLAPDGKSIIGTWQTVGSPKPMSLARVTKDAAWVIDPSPHKITFVTVDKNMKLEVLDWGGTGRPLVFLAGLGATAHVFDKFAPKFTTTNHVYGITRRGFGASSKPEPTATNYTSDRLGDDVLAVIASLKLDHPVLVGHSLAGEELSSIGSLHPEKVAGLIYLDAAFPYAYYSAGYVGSPAGENLFIDANDLKKKLDQLQKLHVSRDPLGSWSSAASLIHELQTALPQFEKDLSVTNAQLQPASSAGATLPETLQDRISDAIEVGWQKYTDIKPPVLAIYAVPEAIPADATPALKAIMENNNAASAVQADAFQAGMPSARVVRLANSAHTVWTSNEADVTREMNDFLAKLQ